MHCDVTGVIKADFGKHGTARRITQHILFKAYQD